MPTQNNLKDLFSGTLKDIYFAERVMRFGPGDCVATTLKSSNHTFRARSTKHVLGRSALQRLSPGRFRRSASSTPAPRRRARQPTRPRLTSEPRTQTRGEHCIALGLRRHKTPFVFSASRNPLGIAGLDFSPG